ncbi:hypothetical protein ACV1EB_12560 [Aeromonas caviae]|uniref:hypothetical protein n=1 Tax=Aeromonas caviae TaxID=648 RepID=UPI0024498427|nr:hypothetical protein [Aeromonas caviae]MDH1848000.1 hypothetical protein [Aeromonas caviae]
MELSSSVMNAATETEQSKKTAPASFPHNLTSTDELNSDRVVEPVLTAFSIPPRGSKKLPLTMGELITGVFKRIGKSFASSSGFHRNVTIGDDDVIDKGGSTLTDSIKHSEIESVYKHDILNYNYSSDDEIENDNTNKAEPLTSENDIWSPLSHAELVVATGIFSNEKAKARRECIRGGVDHNYDLGREIDCLIHTLNDIKKASTLVPHACVDVIKREIVSISTRLDLTSIEVKNDWARIDELSSSLIAMELMSGRKQIEDMKASLSKMKDENRLAVNYNNMRREKVLFASYGYNQIFSLLDKQTSCIISFIKESPAYDMDYSALNIRYVRALEERFPTVRDLALASYCDLMSTNGVGEATITKIKNRFNELNLPTVFIDDGSMSKRDVYERTMNEHMNNENGFKVPYAICGKRGSVYKPVHFNQYTNYYLFEPFDEDGNPVVNR